MRQKQTRWQRISWRWKSRHFMKEDYFGKIVREFEKVGFSLFDSLQLDSRMFPYMGSGKTNARVTTHIFYKPNKAFLSVFHFYETENPATVGYLCWWELQVLSLLSSDGKRKIVSQLEESMAPWFVRIDSESQGTSIQKFAQLPVSKSCPIPTEWFNCLGRRFIDWAQLSDCAPFETIDVSTITPTRFVGVEALFTQMFTPGGFVQVGLLPKQKEPHNWALYES